MKIFYGYTKDEEEFKQKAIEKYNKLAKTDVGKLYRDKKGIEHLEDAHFCAAKIKDFMVVAISNERIGIAIEEENKKLPKKVEMTLDEYVDYNAYLRWTGKNILLSVAYKSYPMDKVTHFKVLNYIGAVYSIDGSVSKIELK
ncbi:MAG: hypothetical protein K5923_00300 [Clostridia bacterium]|nr:hypothetical protein [Clostridia bacterium]